jgi:hypothetical protein
MADKSRAVNDEPAGTYQVWHRDGDVFRHVANVEAGNYMAAVVLPLFERGTPGTEGVTWLVDSARPTTYGDKIVDPLGAAYEIYKPEYGGTALRETSIAAGRSNAIENTDRDELLRETYRLSHELGYIGFRHQHFNDPDAIKEWPDPAVREIELRDFWETGGCDSALEGFASYRKSHANESVEHLAAYRDQLRGLLAGGKDERIAYFSWIVDLAQPDGLLDYFVSEANAESNAVSEHRDAVRDSVARKQRSLSFLNSSSAGPSHPWPSELAKANPQHEPQRMESQGKELPIERVERQLRDCKTSQPWEGAMSEAGKLRVLEGSFDWTGVTAKEKQGVLVREVDFAEVTPTQFKFVYQNIRDEKMEQADETVARGLFDQSRIQTGTRAMRPATENLVESVTFDDVWPRNAAIVDFGIESQEHYEALYYPLRHGDITPGQVDAALGNGRKLTELVNSAPNNPHKGIEFRTYWDDLQVEPGNHVARPAEPPERGEYQVWHARDLDAVFASELEREPYLHGHSHIANVQADSLDQALKLTDHIQTPSWPQHPQVQSMTANPRSTFPGDVIVDPKGKPHHYGRWGFSEVAAVDQSLFSPGASAEDRGVRFQDVPNRPRDHVEARGKLGPPHSWPSEIARANRQKHAGQDQGKSNGNEKANGHDDGHSM